MRWLIICAMIGLCLLGAGCSNNDAASQINQISKDTSLTAAERNAKIAEIGKQMPMNPTEIEYGGGTIAIIVIMGIVLAIALKLRKDQQPEEAPAMAPDILATAEARSAQTFRPAATRPDGAGAPAAKPADAGGPPAAPSRPGAAEAAARKGLIAPSQIIHYDLPNSQAEVDAIPRDQLGTSFFSSRPIPFSLLVEVEVNVGGAVQTVNCTQKEAAAVLTETVPTVRAFSVDGVVKPWFKWREYDPYTQYWAMSEGDFGWGDNQVETAWLKLEDLSPNLSGYLGPLVDEPDEAPAEAAEAPAEEEAAAD